MSPPKTRGPGFASDARGTRHYHLANDVQIFIAPLAPLCLDVLILAVGT